MKPAVGHYAQTIYSVLKHRSAKSLANNLINILRQNGDLKLLPRILERLKIISEEKENYRLAQIHVSQPLSPFQQKTIQKILAHKFGHRIVVKQVISPEVLGGLAIVVGDELIDGTMSTQLKTLGEKLWQTPQI